MKGLFIFCLLIGIGALGYSLIQSWQRIQALQELSCEHKECDHPIPPAP